MSTLLKALASAADGLIVPIRKKGSVRGNSYNNLIDVNETCYLTTKDGIFVIKNLNNYKVYNVDTKLTLAELTDSDIFGKPLALGNPKACFIDNTSSFIEFLNLATHKPNEIKKLLVGFIVDEKTMYTYDYNLSVYDISTGEEKDIRDESIQVSLLSETGNLVFIDGGEIHDLSELDFDMLKEFGMC